MNNASSFKRHIPNAITCSRLLFFGGIIWLLMNDNFQFVLKGHIVTNLHLVLVLYFFGAMTDVIDGPLARRWHVASDLGDALDHTIDRIFILPGLYILLHYLFGIPLIVALILEVVTIIIGLSVAWKRRKGIRTNQFPNRFGKNSYIFSIVTVCIVCLAVKWQLYWHSFAYVANGALCAAIVLRIASLIKYFRKT